MAQSTFTDRMFRGLHAASHKPSPQGGFKVPPLPKVKPAMMASGGLVPGRGLGDHVPAMLTPGEAVLPRSTVAAIGPGAVRGAIAATSGAQPGGLRAGGHYADGMVPSMSRQVLETGTEPQSQSSRQQQNAPGAAPSALLAPGAAESTVRSPVQQMTPVPMSQVTGVPTMLSPGEAVLPQSTVAALGPQAVGNAIQATTGARPGGLRAGGHYAGGMLGLPGSLNDINPTSFAPPAAPAAPAAPAPAARPIHMDMDAMRNLGAPAPTGAPSPATPAPGPSQAEWQTHADAAPNAITPFRSAMPASGSFGSRAPQSDADWRAQATPAMRANQDMNTLRSGNGGPPTPQAPPLTTAQGGAAPVGGVQDPPGYRPGMSQDEWGAEQQRQQLAGLSSQGSVDPGLAAAPGGLPHAPEWAGPAAAGFDAFGRFRPPPSAAPGILSRVGNTLKNAGNRVAGVAGAAVDSATQALRPNPADPIPAEAAAPAAEAPVDATGGMGERAHVNPAAEPVDVTGRMSASAQTPHSPNGPNFGPQAREMFDSHTNGPVPTDSVGRARAAAVARIRANAGDMSHVTEAQFKQMTGLVKSVTGAKGGTGEWQPTDEMHARAARDGFVQPAPAEPAAAAAAPAPNPAAEAAARNAQWRDHYAQQPAAEPGAGEFVPSPDQAAKNAAFRARAMNPPSEAAGPSLSQRMANASGDVRKGVISLGGKINAGVTSAARSVVGKSLAPAAAIYDAAQRDLPYFTDPTATGKLRQAGNDVGTGASGLAGGYAGAVLGGTLGAATGPLAPLAVPLGALAGGAYGYYKGNEAGREFFGDSEGRLDYGKRKSVPMAQHVNFSPQALAWRKANGQPNPGDQPPEAQGPPVYHAPDISRGQAPPATQAVIDSEQMHNDAQNALPANAGNMRGVGQGSPYGLGAAAMTAGNTNLRALASNSGLRAGLNNYYGAAGNGMHIDSTTGANGKPQVLLTGAQASKPQFTDTEGNPTNDYTQTAQYAQGMDTQASYKRGAAAYDKRMADEQSARENAAPTSFAGLMQSKLGLRRAATQAVLSGQNVEREIAMGKQGTERDIAAGVQGGEHERNQVALEGHKMTLQGKSAQLRYDAMMKNWGDNRDDDKSWATTKADPKGGANVLDQDKVNRLTNLQAALHRDTGLDPRSYDKGTAQRVRNMSELFDKAGEHAGDLYNRIRGIVTGARARVYRSPSEIPAGGMQRADRYGGLQPSMDMGTTSVPLSELEGGGGFTGNPLDAQAHQELDALTQAVNGRGN